MGYDPCLCAFLQGHLPFPNGAFKRYLAGCSLRDLESLALSETARFVDVVDMNGSMPTATRGTLLWVIVCGHDLDTSEECKSSRRRSRRNPMRTRTVNRRRA